MTRKPGVLTTIFTLAISLSSPLPLAAERVEHPGAGIALDRPTGWHTATLAQVQENRQRVRLSDEELQRGLVTRSAMPVLTFMKHGEPFAGLNPTIQVTLRPAVGGAPTRVLAMALETMRRAFADFRLVSEVEAVEIDGWSGAHARATYTLQNQAGERFAVMTRLWLVPRGPLMFLIGMSGAPQGEDACEAEFAAVVRSIDIQD
jgi:hypothetical protein